MKKITAAIMALIFALSINICSGALTDDYILNDPIDSTFEGRTEAPSMIENMRFTDVAPGYWAQQAIVRGGALDLIKPYDKRFYPAANVTKQEALAFVLRAAGYETRAVALGTTLAAQYPQNGSENAWALGYLNYAMQLGLITPADYASSLATDVTAGMPSEAVVFDRFAPATREEVANWLYRAVNAEDDTLFTPSKPMEKLYTFSDWRSVDTDKALAVDVIAANNIMVGSGGSFNPKNNITRAEMAQVLASLDSVYFTLSGIERRTGTVGALRDAQYTATGQADLWRNVYVRKSDGTMDVLTYSQPSGMSPQNTVKDAVVFRDNAVGGLASLQEGDVIEYLTRPEDGSVLYVNVISPGRISEVQGILYQVDPAAKSINVKGSGDKQYVFSMIDGLLTVQNGVNYLTMDDKKHIVQNLPYGSIVSLRLVNDIVTDIRYIGQPEAAAEIRGIVVENEPNLGYITVIDNNGNRVTKNYYESGLLVEKQRHYDNDDEIGYFDKMFPYFQWNPRNATIAEIEPGDIVFMTVSPDDPSAISRISAATNYIMRYGKIKQINRYADYLTILLEFENKQVSWYDVADGIFISRDGKLIKPSDVKIGDWAKFLVNEAIIEPGYTIESVKEMTVEGDEHFISTIIKGTLSGINTIQNQLVIEGAQTLAKTGWTNYRDLTQLSTAGRDIEYYYNGQRITLDYAARYFKNSDVQAYVAMENNFTGEKVKKVTFRLGRDEVLDADTVLDSNGAGAFSVLGYNGNISSDVGTIVRRHGRLVDGTDVMPSDYLSVVLNGDGKAAVIDITDFPDTSQVMIARGRVGSVKDSVSFKVQSVSMLNGTTWVYTPVQREYAIDAKTLFLDGDGYVDPAKFVGYTEDSVVDRVFNIITDGSRASYVIDAPYANRAVRGTIYRIDDDMLYLKDAYVLDDSTNRWNAVSSVNNTMVVTVYPNTVIAKNNAVVAPGALVAGDQLQVMTNAVPDRPTAGMGVNAYIITVQK